MPEFDASTQFQGRPVWASEGNRKLFQLARNIGISYAKSPRGELLYKKAPNGKYVDADGNILEEPVFNPALEDAAQFRNRVEEFKKKLVPLETIAPFQRYQGERIQGLTPDQESLYQEAQNLPEQFAHSRAREGFEDAVLPGVHAQESLENANRYRVPYEDLFKAWEEQAKEKFKERVNKEISPLFIASGGWGSGGHRKLLQKTLADNERDLRHLQADYMNRAYEKALDRGQKTTDIRQQSLRDLSHQEGEAYRKKLGLFDVRHQLANQKQKLGQAQKDWAYDEFAREREHPMRTMERLSNVNMGYQHNVPTETTNMAIGTHPSLNQPSMQSVLGGVGLMTAGMLGGRPQMPGAFAEGGSVHDEEEENFANGGQTSYLGPVSRSPLDLVKAKVNKNHNRSNIMDLFANVPMEMNRPLPTDQELHLNSPEINRLRQHADQLKATEPSPFWDALAGFGAGMLGSKGRNTTEMLMGGGPRALDEFKESNARHEARHDKITDLNQAIEQTRQVQMNREMQFRQLKDKSMFDRIVANQKAKKDERLLGLQERKLDIMEKGLSLKGEALEKKPLKLNKVDNDILHDASLMLKNSPEMERKLDRLKELSGKINSGGLLKDASPYMASFPGGQGAQADLEEFDKTAKDLVIDATRLFGERGGARIAAIIDQTKPSRRITSDANVRVANSISSQVTRDNERADFVMEAYNDYGIAPTKAVQLYNDYEKRRKKNPDASPWESIDPTHTFDSHHNSYLQKLAEGPIEVVQEMYEKGLLTDDEVMEVADYAETEKSNKKAA